MPKRVAVLVDRDRIEVPPRGAGEVPIVPATRKFFPAPIVEAEYEEVS